MRFGGIAQMGERLNGIQEVSGSIPLISIALAMMYDSQLKIKSRSCDEIGRRNGLKIRGLVAVPVRVRS